MNQDKVTPVIQLLQRASAAHGEYETKVLGGVYDQDWPIWYAQWAVTNGLNELLGSKKDAQELSTILYDLNEKHKQTDKSQSWAEYTAQQLITLFG
jgi:hypothetical protein